MTQCYDPLTDRVLDLEWVEDAAQWQLDSEGEFPTSVPLAVPLTPQSLPFGPKRSFLPESTFQFAYDSVSLDLLRTCPRKYQLVMIEGWHPKTLAPPLAFGLHFHTCLETWYKLLNHGMDKEAALLSLCRLALLLGERLPEGDKYRTKESLVRTVIWYIDQFWDDHAETLMKKDGSPMVELSFALPIMDLEHGDTRFPSPIQILYCGHMDRPVKFQGKNYCTDYKTSVYELNPDFFSAFKPSGQMSGYNIAGHVILQDGCAGIIIDGIQLGVNYSRFRRHIINYTPEEIEEDIRDIQQWVRVAKGYSDANYWPKQPTACGRYFKTQERAIIDAGCPFREICSKPSNVRQIYLKGKFIQRNWDPLVPR